MAKKKVPANGARSPGEVQEIEHLLSSVDEVFAGREGDVRFGPGAIFHFRAAEGLEIGEGSTCLSRDARDEIVDVFRALAAGHMWRMWIVGSDGRYCVVSVTHSGSGP